MLTVERHSPQVAVDGHPAASEQLRQLSHRKTEMLRKHMRRRLAPHRRRHPERALPQLVERPRGARLRLRSPASTSATPSSAKPTSPRARSAHLPGVCASFFVSFLPARAVSLPPLFRVNSECRGTQAGESAGGRAGEWEGWRVGGFEGWRVRELEGWRV